jgi:hypothetical protein
MPENPLKLKRADQRTGTGEDQGMTFGNRVLVGAALSGILFGSLGCMNAPKQAAVPSAATAPALLARAQEQAPMTTEQRQEYRDQLLKILPPDPTFDKWIKDTNALRRTSTRCRGRS